jgi:hypothetical protein
MFIESGGQNIYKEWTMRGPSYQLRTNYFLFNSHSVGSGIQAGSTRHVGH